MSKPVIAAATIVAVLAGGYTAVWFKYAGNAKAQLVQSIASINEKTKPMLKNSEMIHYDSIDTSGFPFALTLTIAKPVVNVPADGLLRLMPDKKGIERKVPADFTWVEEISQGDNVSITSNLIGSELTIVSRGNLTQKATVNGQLRHSLVNEYASPITCHMHTTPSGFLVINPVVTDAESFFNIFHELDCNIGAVTTKDATTGAAVASQGKGDIVITHNDVAGNRNASLKFNLADVSYTAVADPIVNDFLQMIATGTGQTPQPLGYSLAEMGKSNFNVDLAYNGPDNSQAFSDKALKMNFDINALDFSSSLINSQTVMHVAVAPDMGDRKGSLVLHTKTNISERYDQILAVQTKKTIEELSKTEGKTGTDLEAAQDLAHLGSPDALVNAVLPHFHPLGDMVIDIDAKLQGPNEESTFLTQGHHVLSAFNILTAPYGIKASGEATGAKDKAPSGNLAVTCINCDALISDAGDYIIRFTNYMDAMHPDKKAVRPTKALYDGVRTFAHSIALNGNDAGAKDLNFNVVMKDSGEFTVSGKQIMEVMQSYMTNVTPNIPAQPAPAVPSQDLPPLVRPQQ